MDYFEFIGSIEYNKAKLRIAGIEPKEILVKDLRFKNMPDPMFCIEYYDTICGLKVIRTDELDINDYRIILPKY